MTNEPAVTSNVNPSMSVGLVGAGRRVEGVHLPVLRELADRYPICGFVTRSDERREALARATGIPAYQSPERLVEEARPDCLLVAVAPDANEQVFLELVALQRPMLAETPLAWRVSAGRRIVHAARDRGVLLGVAEQTPFLPLEQLKRMLIDRGVFGHVHAVQNDFASYAYHGVAQLRRYLSGDPIEVQAVERSLVRTGGVGGQHEPRDVRWLLGQVDFSDGAILLHHDSRHYADSPLCFPRSIRIYGERAAMVDGRLKVRGGTTEDVETVDVVRDEHEGSLRGLAIDIPGAGIVRWNNPHAGRPFTDDQIAVATLLDAMARAIADGGSPLYSADEALRDVEIVQAMHYSARRSGGRSPAPARNASEAPHRAAARAPPLVQSSSGLAEGLPGMEIISGTLVQPNQSVAAGSTAGLNCEFRGNIGDNSGGTAEGGLAGMEHRAAAGDLNLDGVVDVIDLVQLIVKWG